MKVPDVDTRPAISIRTTNAKAVTTRACPSSAFLKCLELLVGTRFSMQGNPGH